MEISYTKLNLMVVLQHGMDTAHLAIKLRAVYTLLIAYLQMENKNI